MELINIAGIALLMLLVRKLIWCLRWLWCYYHGRPTPEPISFLPRRSGSVFNGHVDQTGRDQEEGRWHFGANHPGKNRSFRCAAPGAAGR